MLLLPAVAEKNGLSALTYFEDGINADRQAMDYKKKEAEVTNSTKLTMRLVRNGGWAGIIE